MKCQNKYKISLGIVLLTMAVTFFAFGALNNSKNVANAATEGTAPPEHQIVTSREDASKITGYAVTTLKEVPTDLLAPSHVEIWDTPDRAKAAMQIWGSLDSGYFLSLIQDPSSAGIVLAEPFAIGTLQGERLFIDASVGLPSRLALFWRDGAMTYQMFGTITGSLNEQALIRIANSLAAK